MPRDAFDQWIATARDQGDALDEAAFHRLAEPSRADRPRTFRDVTPDLFTAIANPGAHPALTAPPVKQGP
ncbi:COX aromatic rich motif-containing protein [Nitrospirillum sp. BR 11752]|uniref:COX aromatic rich motif-containing protein n=1 Tax=Nitrospirillum sp. BR 11752 TaxID=3104293 RepID=UPI002EA2C571|nr:COX aromatic rich motif-containing protein [Nitrospirillum sp. BR 11752]